MFFQRIAICRHKSLFKSPPSTLHYNFKPLKTFSSLAPQKSPLSFFAKAKAQFKFLFEGFKLLMEETKKAKMLEFEAQDGGFNTSPSTTKQFKQLSREEFRLIERNKKDLKSKIYFRSLNSVILVDIYRYRSSITVTCSL